MSSIELTMVSYDCRLNPRRQHVLSTRMRDGIKSKEMEAFGRFCFKPILCGHGIDDAKVSESNDLRQA